MSHNFDLGPSFHFSRVSAGQDQGADQCEFLILTVCFWNIDNIWRMKLLILVFILGQKTGNFW